jgi:WD40 repeat protein
VRQDGLLFSGSYDKTMRVWSCKDGTHLHTLTGHEGAVESFAFGRDGSVFSCSESTSENLLMW